MGGTSIANGQSILDTYRAIERFERCTRAEVAADTGRSVVTVCKNVDLLLHNNLVFEEKDESSTLGRKACVLHISASARTILMLDITKLQFSSRLIDLKNNDVIPKLKHEYHTSKSFADNLLAFFVASHSHFWGSESTKNSGIGIGVIVPGPYINSEDRVINNRLPELCTVHLKEMIQSVFGDKEVLIEEDVKLAGLYSAELAGDKPPKVTFYAYIDEGVGGSIIKNGAIDLGAYAFAGDFGQLRLASERTVEQEISLASFRYKLGLCSPEDAYTDDFLAQVNFASPQVLAVCKEIIHHTALALYNVSWLVDPYYIIIESVYCTYIPHFVEQVAQQMASLLYDTRDKLQPRILSSNSAVQYAYKGAASMLLSRYLFLL